MATSEQFHAISSPNYPSNYPNYADKTITIRSPVGTGVQLDILDLGIESSCSYDTLRIYYGKLFNVMSGMLLKTKNGIYTSLSKIDLGV